MNEIKFIKTHPAAKLPQAAHDGDVGLDLSCVENFCLACGDIVKVKTGINIASFEGCCGFLKIEGRSSLASEGIIPVGGIIDLSYRGEIIVMLTKISEKTEKIRMFNAGQKIAQLVFYKTYVQNVDLLVSEGASKNDVAETSRGSDGFGSTGR